MINNEKVTYYQRNKAKILQKARDYYEKNKQKSLKRSRDYYEKNKEKIKEDRRNKYSTLSIEDKKINQEKWREWYPKLDNEKKKIRNASKERYHALLIT